MASEEDVLLREVDEDLQRDQTFQTLEKYRGLLIGGAVTVLAGVGGYQYLDSEASKRQASAAEAYAEYSFAADEPPSADALKTFAGEQDNGYGVLAAFRAAAAYGAEGDLEGARDLYAEIYGGTTASPGLRDLARIRAAHVLLDKRPAEASSIVSLLETQAFRPHAEEVLSAAALLGGEHEAARAGFEALAMAPDTPPGMKVRAEAFAAIADAARNGATITKPATEADTRSFIERFGSELEAAGAPTTDPADPLAALQNLIEEATPSSEEGDGEVAEPAPEGPATEQPEADGAAEQPK